MYSFLRVRGGAVTVNEKILEPPAAVSVTVAVPAEAVEAILNVAEAEVLELAVTLLKVKPGHVVDSVTELNRLLPLIVTLTLVPCVPLLGLTEVTVGAGGGSIVIGAETVTHGSFWLFLIAVNT